MSARLSFCFPVMGQAFFNCVKNVLITTRLCSYIIVYAIGLNKMPSIAEMLYIDKHLIRDKSVFTHYLVKPLVIICILEYGVKCKN